MVQWSYQITIAQTQMMIMYFQSSFSLDLRYIFTATVCVNSRDGVNGEGKCINEAVAMQYTKHIQYVGTAALLKG